MQQKHFSLVRALVKSDNTIARMQGNIPKMSPPLAYHLTHVLYHTYRHITACMIPRMGLHVHEYGAKPIDRKP